MFSVHVAGLDPIEWDDGVITSTDTELVADIVAWSRGRDLWATVTGPFISAGFVEDWRARMTVVEALKAYGWIDRDDEATIEGDVSEPPFGVPPDVVA